ncbi:Ig-like domain-containing protein [Pontibacter ruber]|uniref:Ig-like domain-containing protein n=1 Tax=Pontibacter ruber TaxID=1343895 RepID=A0ABW5CYI1_9BACT|nr:Ig-like domain-containing protein [Pontibacter ruber]
MRRHVSNIGILQLLAVILLLWGCDKTEEDVIPRSFQEFTLYPDDIYTFNSNSDWINRLDPLANDSVKAQVKVTYSQPQHGQLLPEFDGPGTMGYKPNNDFYGIDSFTYTVCTSEICKSETIRMIVEKPYDPATCTTLLAPDSLETTKNTFKGIRIFENDRICFNDSYGGNYIEKPVKGTFRTIEYSGSYKNTIYVYYPPKDYVGEDSFRYRVYTSRDRSTYQEIIVKVTVK